MTAVGAGIILLMGRRVNLRGAQPGQGSNEPGFRPRHRAVRAQHLCHNAAVRGPGRAAELPVLRHNARAVKAIGLSIFHSVAAFNNSGFDILGGGTNLIPYQDDVLLNLVTCGLIICGGIGFLVIREMWNTRLHWKKFSMHTKVVLSTTRFC